MLSNYQHGLILPPLVASPSGQIQQQGMTVVYLMTAVTILGMAITIYVVLTV